MRTKEGRGDQSGEEEEEGTERMEQVHKWLEDTGCLDSHSTERTTTAACQTFNQGLMNKTNKSRSDTLEALSAQQACQSH